MTMEPAFSPFSAFEFSLTIVRGVVADNSVGDRMAEYIFLMHDDGDADEKGWKSYVRRLEQGGFFEGGSAIGDRAFACEKAARLLR